MTLVKWQYLETWETLALASGPEACARHDNQIADQQQVEEPEWAI